MMQLALEYILVLLSIDQMKDRPLYNHKRAFFDYIDFTIEATVKKFIRGESISDDLLENIRELYFAANSEKDFKTESFESAYHTPVTGFIKPKSEKFTIEKSESWMS